MGHLGVYSHAITSSRSGTDHKAQATFLTLLVYGTYHTAFEAFTPELRCSAALIVAQTVRLDVPLQRYPKRVEVDLQVSVSGVRGSENAPGSKIRSGSVRIGRGLEVRTSYEDLVRSLR